MFRMVKFIPVDINIHRSILVEFNVEYVDWTVSEVQKRYDIDLTSTPEQTVQEYVESNIESLACMHSAGLSLHAFLPGSC